MRKLIEGVADALGAALGAIMFEQDVNAAIGHAEHAIALMVIYRDLHEQERMREVTGHAA